MIRQVHSILTTIAFAFALSACGGGGSGGGSQLPPPLQSVAGIWEGQLVAGAVVNDVSCLITEAGEGACTLYEPVTGAIIGGLRAQIAVVNRNQLSGSGTAYTVPGYVLPDGVSTLADVTVTGGTVSTRNSVELRFSILGSSGVLTVNFNGIYDRDSSLDAVAGAYSGFEIDGQLASFSVDTNGVLFGETLSGCEMTGQVIVIDPAYNGYDVNVNLNGCQGFNGGYGGLFATGDSAATNDALSFAVFNNAGAIFGLLKRFDRPIDIYKLDTGIFTSCATDDNGVHCWGQSPVSVVPPNANVTTLRTASHLASCLIDDSGLNCWGGAASSILSPPILQSPIAVDVHAETACVTDLAGVLCWGARASEFGSAPALSNPRDIALSYGGGVWACVLDDSGVQCWGDSTSGQLIVPTLANPRQITAGEGHACALDDTGVVCWGRNDNGQANVPPLSNPVQVSAGLFYTCAVHDPGVICWGGEGLPVCNDNNCGPGYDYGQTQVPPLIDPFHVSVGYTHICALDRMGATCWGRNSVGEADDRGLVFSY